MDEQQPTNRGIKMSNWTQPGQGFKGLDEQIEAISEQQVVSYFDNLMEQDEEQLVELLQKIKGKIKNFKDKRDFKKRASELAKHHSDSSAGHGKSKDHHDDHHQAHGKTSAAMKAHKHPESANSSSSHKHAESEHKTASRHHDQAKNAHDLAKKAAEKGDHEAYKKHSQAAKNHTERANHKTKRAATSSSGAEESSQHADTGDRDMYNHISKKHGGNK